VYGQNGITGIVTSVVVPEQVHEPDRAQTLHQLMVVTIVRVRLKKLKRVYWLIAQVDDVLILIFEL